MKQFATRIIPQLRYHDLPNFLRYLIPTLLVLVGLAVHMTYLDFFGAAKFLFFYPIVFLSAWLFGAGPGLYALFHSAVSITIFFIPHLNVLPYLSFENFIRVAGFVFNMLLVIWIINKNNQDEKRLLQSQKVLHEALIYRDEFLSIASHELKTPLTSLKLQSQMFMRESSKYDPLVYSPEKINKVIDQVDRQVTRLSRLVDDMLDISRIRTGKLSISPERVNVPEMVREVFERMKPQFIESLADLPKISLCEDTFIDCDKMRMEQVVSNLINNALKYGEKKAFSLKVENKRDRVLISVSDNGIGISPENHEKIFNRFQRAVPASEVSGLGLGLYIARLIVEAHGGALTLQSELGRGATFNIELPHLIEEV